MSFLFILLCIYVIYKFADPSSPAFQRGARSAIAKGIRRSSR